jgi:transcription elongation factor Elf1
MTVLVLRVRRVRIVYRSHPCRTTMAQLMSAPVGADIESICGKCGDVWHVVVAKKGESIAKVQCKQCSGYHRYKPPGGSARVPRSSTASKRASKGQSVSRRIDEPQVAANDEKPVLPYKFSDNYEPGDRIEHPKFGFGVVEITAEPGKMQVFFPDGRRVLATAKKRDVMLTRPSREPTGSQEPPKW